MLRFILVNDRSPRAAKSCAFCCAPIDQHISYVREISTRIIYCGCGCYLEHVNVTVLAIEYHRREVS